MSFSDLLNDIFSPLNEYIWYIAFVCLIGLGLYFLVRLKFMQVVHIKENATLAVTGVNDKTDGKKLSSFEAFCLGMGARIGVGNIAGVATAIATGGPGAVFWMWIFALIGAGTSFMESTAAQIYKEKKSDGSYYGGPAYYATKGLKKRWLGVVLAILITVTFGIGFVGVQASNSSAAIVEAFNVDSHIVGFVIALIAGLVIFSGTKIVGRFSAKIVPAMAVFWIIFTIAIIVMNFGNVGNAFAMIFQYAFSAPALLGGGIGTIIMVGLKRGVFSNEAGLGSIANLAGTADTTHPVKQGLIQSFGVIVDTVIVCTFTAIAVLSFGNWEEVMALGLRGAPLVQEVASQALGTWAPTLIAMFLFVFAFTSMLGYYTMSEANLRFVKDHNTVVFVLRVVVVLVAFASCTISTALMDLISDTFMAAMGAVNVIVVALLAKPVMEAYRDYRKQQKEGIKEPIFHKSALSDSDGVTEWED
ncbi:MAG: alanine:cation symporter family protein [Thermoplasmata archaeon]|jgi:AGCS family alanine or glycine:cation symporter/putative sodium/glutamine symporter|nr:alanine:cation symporter family protein [Thermoplasmata archaeon]MBR4244392.1 alanine:cation symporter family protein [Candidatus Methanomethylophilaceae archaeon]